MSEFTVSRVTKLQKMITSSTQKLDGLLVVKPTNVTYLSGFTGDSTYLLVFPESAALLSDSRYTIQLYEEAPEIPARIRNAKTSLQSMAEREITDQQHRGTFRLGIESDGMSYQEFLDCQTKFQTKNIEVVPVKGLVEQLRSIKDKFEISQIRQAVYIAQKAYKTIMAGLLPSMLEREIAVELEYQMRKMGATDLGFHTIVGVGSRAALPHAVPGNARVDESDLLLIDWGADVGGYKSDFTRTAVTGKLTPKFKKIYGIVREAQQAAIAAIKPDVACNTIDSIARDVINKAGYGKNFGHGLGHSVGLDIHESPSFAVKDETILKPGMVLTVEPGIYLESWGGIRIEDDILVTKDGCEVLTSALSSQLEDMIFN